MPLTASIDRRTGRILAAVDAKTFSGDIDSAIPMTLRRQNKRSLEADLGSGGGRDLRFKTFSGDVTIKR